MLICGPPSELVVLVVEMLMTRNFVWRTGKPTNRSVVSAEAAVCIRQFFVPDVGK